MKEILLNTVRKTKNYKKHSALIDDGDFEKVSKYNWFVFKSRTTIYASTYIKNKMILMHNFIMGGKGIDHKDGNGLNNQKDNLRKCTNQQNQWNQQPQKGKSSKYKGVCWGKHCGKWLATIKHNSVNINLGSYDSETDAAKAYNEKAKELFGEFAYQNKVNSHATKSQNY